MSQPISIVDAFTYYRNAPHQLEAARYLDNSIPPDIRDTFSRIYRDKIIDLAPNRKHGKLADQVYQCCQKRQYPLATGKGEVNIVGVEGINLDGSFNNDEPDRWNDLVGLLGFDRGIPFWHCLFVGTTEPGSYYTNNPLAVGGAARLDTGYHEALWQLGQHRGYTALVQTGTARLVRDANRNHRRDDKTTFEKWRGVNLHTTKTTGWRGLFNLNSIGKWSAGCTVIQVPEDFQIFMGHVMNSAQYKANNWHEFDYRLIWSRWLN